MKIIIRGNLSDAERESIIAELPVADIVVCKEEEDVAPHLSDAEVVLGPLRPDLLPQARRLKLLQVTSAGVDRLLSEELSRSPAALCTASGIHGDTIAEHVLMLMLAMVRKLPAYVHAQSRREWQSLDLELLNGKIVGIVGFGSIGQEIGLRAKAFGMKVVGLRRSKPDTVNRAVADDVWGEEELPRLAALADHLVVALPLTPATRGIISREILATMKQGAYIYNIGRGPIIDEGALVEALQSGRLAGAGLDVFATEPLPQESPLWGLPNVIVTPHSAGGMPGYRERAFAIFLENLRRLRDGQELLNQVDKEAGY